MQRQAGAPRLFAAYGLAPVKSGNYTVPAALPEPRLDARSTDALECESSRP